MLVFDFGVDGRVCVSIEVRYRKDQHFAIVRSFYRQQELIFLVADERDVILRRTKHGRHQTADLYRLNVSMDIVRTAFLDYVAAINDLYEKPRWYHGLCMNCTTTFYRLPNSRYPHRLPCSWPTAARRHFTRTVCWTEHCPSTNFSNSRGSTTSPTQRRRPILETISAASWKGADMNDDIPALLKVHEYFRGASDDALRDVRMRPGSLLRGWGRRPSTGGIRRLDWVHSSRPIEGGEG